MLVEAGADKEATTDGGETPQHKAAGNGHVAAMRLPVEQGAEIGELRNKKTVGSWKEST